jgi:hypothetical protein
MWNDKEQSSPKKYWIVILPVLVGLFVANASFQANKREAELSAKIARYALAVNSYNEYGKDCFRVTSENGPNYQVNPRSAERLSSVIEYFSEIMKAKCIILQDDKIYHSGYKSDIQKDFASASPGTPKYEVWQGILNAVDYGMPFLRTGGSICADGSYSGSVGRGTCSWHGGYGYPRGSKFEFSYLTPVHDPRPFYEYLLSKKEKG